MNNFLQKARILKKHLVGKTLEVKGIRIPVEDVEIFYDPTTTTKWVDVYVYTNPKLWASFKNNTELIFTDFYKRIRATVEQCGLQIWQYNLLPNTIIMKTRIEKTQENNFHKKIEAEEQATSGSSGAVEAPISSPIKRSIDEQEPSLGDFPPPVTDDTIAPVREGLHTLLHDIKKYHPALVPYVEKVIGRQADADGHVSYHKLAKVLITILESMDITVSPNWHIVPHPQLNETEEEVEEQTTTASSGAYETPQAWAKGKGEASIRNSRAVKSKLFRKNLLGGPGAKYVTVKKKCKKFPYCNQGDIGALNFFENETVQQAITEAARLYKVDEEKIASFLFDKIFMKKDNNETKGI